jgi:hypothetical protein
MAKHDALLCDIFLGEVIGVGSEEPLPTSVYIISFFS